MTEETELIIRAIKSKLPKLDFSSLCEVEAMIKSEKDSRSNDQ